MIIGIGHRSDHGKDTFANYLCDNMRLLNPKLKVKKLSWAWKLKDICQQLYGHLGLMDADFYDTDEGRKLRNIPLQKINLTPVEIWIKVGTPAIREQVWEDTWLEWVVAQSKLVDIIVCADTRFPNEISRCDYKIKVHNPDKPDRDGLSVDHHLANYMSWDRIIINDKTKDHLNREALLLARWILKRHYEK
jgi:hypothetical protein